MTEPSQKKELEYPKLWMLCTSCDFSIPETRVFINNNTAMIDLKCPCTRLKEDPSSNSKTNPELIETSIKNTYHNRIETLKLEDYLTYITNLQNQKEDENIKYCLNGHGKLIGKEILVHDKMIFNTKHLISTFQIDLKTCCQFNIHQYSIATGKMYSKLTEQVLCKKCTQKLNNKFKSNIIDLKEFKKTIDNDMLQKIENKIKCNNYMESYNKFIITFIEHLLMSYKYVSKYQTPNYALTKSVLDLYRNINNTQSFSNLYILNPFIQSIQYIKTFSMNISPSESNTFNNGKVLQINKQLSKDNNNNNFDIELSNDFIYYGQGHNIVFGKVNCNPTTQKHIVLLRKEYLKSKVSAMIHLVDNIYFGIYLKSNQKQKNVFYIIKLDTMNNNIKHKSTFIYSSEDQSERLFYDEIKNDIYSYCKINKNTIAITNTNVKLITISDKYDGLSNVSILYKGDNRSTITNIIHWKTKSNQTKVTNNNNVNIIGNLLSTPQHDNEQDYIDYIAFVVDNNKIVMFSNAGTNKEFTQLPEYIIISNLISTTKINSDNNVNNVISYITCMTFINENANKNNFAIGTSNGNVYVVPYANDTQKCISEGHSNKVTCLVTLLSREEFLSGGEDNKIILWEGQTGTILNIFWNCSLNIRNDTHYITSLCLFPSHTLGMFGFLALQNNGTVSYWANQGDIESTQ